LPWRSLRPISSYVILRGADTGWYPYPFLNPGNVGGYGGVATYACGIAVAFVLAAWALLAVGNRLGRRIRSLRARRYDFSRRDRSTSIGRWPVVQTAFGVAAQAARERNSE
jgi:hypothetical protein